MVITIALIFGFALLFGLLNSPHNKKRVVKARKLRDELSKLGLSISSLSPAEMRDRAIRLDTFLSKMLKYNLGNTLGCGENLKLVKKNFSRKDYQLLWEYHKLRNKIVHDNESIDAKELKAMYNIYSKAADKLL